jgi:hypothetical protein
VVVKARLNFAHFLAKAENDAKFIWLNPEEARKSPQGQDTKDNERKSTSAKITARQYATEPILTAAEDFFQIGRSWAGRLRP